MSRKRFSIPLTLGLALLFAGVSIAAATPRPTLIDPADFVSGVDNPFFPLPPGTTFYYVGTEDGLPSTDVMFVTHETKEILGVACTVVHDQVFIEGVLAEDTLDWYAQDVEGNVWYFGEDTKELDAQGNVISTEGSWEGGVDGARPGILMEADPEVGDRYFQEFSKKVAEDQAKVLSLNESDCVPYGCFGNVLRTQEWTQLEPGVIGDKDYAANVGLIREFTVKGGNDVSELVAITME